MARRSPGLPSDWVQPRWLSTGDRAAAPVGTVEGGVAAWVDRCGLVAPVAGRWSLDWWVGAEDGWHVPSREPASRVHQGLLGAAPVVETAMRVPGGEVVQRCFAVRLRGADTVVVEVENRSHVPVALALAVRPYDLTATSTVRRIGLSGQSVLVDGAPVLALGRAPAYAAAAAGDTDVADAVLAGTQRPAGTVGEERDRAGRAGLAVVLPLPHTATLRVLLGASVGPDDADGAPGAEQVVRGWDAHLGAGTRVVVPDDALQPAVDACRAALLLHAADELAFDRPPVVAALERWGFGPAVDRLADRRGYRLLEGHGLLVPDAELGDAGAPFAAGIEATPGRLAALAAAEPWRSTLDGRAEPGAAAVELLLAVRRALVADGDGGVDLLPLVDPAWLGQGVEVHHAPTAAGPVSYAVRWHGARPALLWEAPEGVVVRAPALDPTWSGRGPSGEALLAPVEPPGGLPGVYRSVQIGDGAPDEPGSFT